MEIWSGAFRWVLLLCGKKVSQNATDEIWMKKMVRQLTPPPKKRPQVVALTKEVL